MTGKGSQVTALLAAIGLLALASASSAATHTQDQAAHSAGCLRPSGVVKLVWSSKKYPNIRRHALAAIRGGWPSVLVVNRVGASSRRKRLLAGIPTRAGYDRDEYPPAVGRGVGFHLQSGSGPTGWKADVRYVPSRENRSHGSSMGAKLRKYCNGTRFQYAWT